MAPRRPPEPDQLGFDDMPTELLRVTPARLATWQRCPRRYRMTYLDRPAPPRSGGRAHATLGAVLHNALRALYLRAPERRTVAAGRAAVATAWVGEGFADVAQQAEHRERAQDWVAAYLEQHDPREVDVVGVERWVSAPVGELVVQGRVDRIDARTGADGAEVVVVDYKSGRPPEAGEALASPALALYVLATRATVHQPCRRVELHHLPTGVVQSAEHTDASLREQLDSARGQARAIASAADGTGDPDARYPVRPGPSCSWCDVRRSCPEGQAASEHREPWSGLAP